MIPLIDGILYGPVHCKDVVDKFVQAISDIKAKVRDRLCNCSLYYNMIGWYYCLWRQGNVNPFLI